MLPTSDTIYSVFGSIQYPPTPKTREAKSQRARFCSPKEAIICLHMIDSPSPIQVILEASGLKCPVCNTARWKASRDSVACQSCASSYLFDDGVLRIDGGPKDSTTLFYAAFGGTHFLDTSFSNNPVIHCTTRRYRRFIAEQFPNTRGSMLDFGCGDGRISLWAAENGFSPVVAIDSNLTSLKRLAAEARHRSLFNLLVVCCDVMQAPFVKDHFDAVLCIEVLYYLVLRLGRLAALTLPVGLLKPGGQMILSEMSRYGRSLMDLTAMDVNNFRSLAEIGTRWEKSDQGQLEVYHWSAAELKDDCRQAGLRIMRESGVSPIAGLFDFAWKFTSYPLRPVLDQRLQEIIEELDDQASEYCNLARNILLALKKT